LRYLGKRWLKVLFEKIKDEKAVPLPKIVSPHQQWTIERFHYVLKSGRAKEKPQ
jgi:hypothetical protein